MDLIATGIVSITKSVGVKRIVSPCNDQLGKETKRIGVVTSDDRDLSREAKTHRTISYYVSHWVGRVPFHGLRFFFLIWRILFPSFFMFRFPITSNPINRLLFLGSYHEEKEASQWNADEFLAPSTGRCWARVRRIDLVIKYHHVSFRFCLFFLDLPSPIQLFLVFRLMMSKNTSKVFTRIHYTYTSKRLFRLATFHQVQR